MHRIGIGFVIALLTAIPVAGLAGGSAAVAARAQTPLAQQPVNRIVQEQIYPQLVYFFKKLDAEKEHTSIDGFLPFQTNDKFLPGKIAAGLGDVLLHTPKDDKGFADLLRAYRDIADMTVRMDNHTWGIYYYVSTLYKLKTAGLLDQAISPATLALLKQRLDWRTFVNVPDYQLIDLPTNYYGVAFSVARLRMLLGWEDGSASKILLDKMLTHYREYSGEFGFSDETPGDGRFDRYSILLIAEICERFVETGMPVTPELKKLLRRSADIALATASSSGEGLSFGRSIGVYGDTAQLEILSIAAYLDVLSAEEKQYAYAYAARIVARYVDFWFDPAMHSVDLWGKGRRTDAYRGKNRILGENFSLLHQIVSTNDLWNKAGMTDAMPKLDLQAWLDKTQPAFKPIWFARGEYDRALALYRDRGHVFSLLLVNGGPGQHANSPYYPLPFSHGVVAGVADSGARHPQLLPKFTLADGSELLGTAYIKHIRERQEGKRYVVSYAQGEMDRLGENAPHKDARIRLETEYRFEPGAITRIDRYTPNAKLTVDHINMEFGSFSTDATLAGNKVHFAQGEVTDFEVTGLDNCHVEKAPGNESWRSPEGPMQSVVICATPRFAMQAPLTIQWTIRYRP